MNSTEQAAKRSGLTACDGAPQLRDAGNESVPYETGRLMVPICSRSAAGVPGPNWRGSRPV